MTPILTLTETADAAVREVLLNGRATSSGSASRLSEPGSRVDALHPTRKARAA